MEQLEALYATIPTVDCKRKCQNYCGPILLSKIEAQRLEEKRGWLPMESLFEATKRIDLPSPKIVQEMFIGIRPDRDMRCVFLSRAVGICTVYSIRPLVCRLWGVVNTSLMRCPHGCKPTRWVTDEESKALHEKIIVIQKGET